MRRSERRLRREVDYFMKTNYDVAGGEELMDSKWKRALRRTYLKSLRLFSKIKFCSGGPCSNCDRICFFPVGHPSHENKKYICPHQE